LPPLTPGEGPSIVQTVQTRMPVRTYNSAGPITRGKEMRKTWVKYKRKKRKKSTTQGWEEAGKSYARGVSNGERYKTTCWPCLRQGLDPGKRSFERTQGKYPDTSKREKPTGVSRQKQKARVGSWNTRKKQEKPRPENKKKTCKKGLG